MELDVPLSKALRTTRIHLKRLAELGITTVQDLLLYLPRRYNDSSAITPIAQLKEKELQTIKGMLITLNTRHSFHGRMNITSGLIRDDSGSIEATWFNQPYLSQMFKKGDLVTVSGKPRYKKRSDTLSLSGPTIENQNKVSVHAARIVPIYPETELDRTRKGRLSSKWLREKLFQILPHCELFEEPLPQAILEKYSLMPYALALKNAHFPESETALEKAVHRLAFQELFLLQLSALYRRAQNRLSANGSKQIPLDWERVKTCTQSLPWPLTGAQKKAIYEITRDLSKPYPMSRLLEGDTGSGKTVAAACALHSMIREGFQGCLLAPTEILARQHFDTLSQLFGQQGIKPTLLIGAINDKEKKEIADKISKKEILLVVGTHAILQENIIFPNLGLAVIDEQHRFGVRQREQMKGQGSPHILHMTATPIPRTLALVLYGDQELSILDEKPQGRQKIITRIIPESKREDANKWIREQIKMGRQAFFVFPLINESEKLALKAAVAEFKKLNEEIFSDLRLGLLHGQLSSAEKQKAMAEFKKGEIDILVSTSVVEVGVDVPNATIMIIESAERFGLAQLHQFRGRVGRGSELSYCLLFPTESNSLSRARLEAMEKYDSGFKLAEIDLKLRGPGEVYGTAQSGIPDLKMASLSDSLTIQSSRQAAESLLSEDPSLNKYPLLKKAVQSNESKVAIDY